MERAVENVRRRLLKACGALDAAGLPYAVAGGNAVALWVSRVDEAAVRNTRDVDILIRREDFNAVKRSLEGVGFVYRHVKSLDAFLDGPDAKVRDAVHVLFANERVRPDAVLPNPDVEESERAEAFTVLGPCGADPQQVDGLPGQRPHAPARHDRVGPHHRRHPRDAARPARRTAAGAARRP